MTFAPEANLSAFCYKSPETHKEKVNSPSAAEEEREEGEIVSDDEILTQSSAFDSQDAWIAYFKAQQKQIDDDVRALFVEMKATSLELSQVHHDRLLEKVISYESWTTLNNSNLEIRKLACGDSCPK